MAGIAGRNKLLINWKDICKDVLFALRKMGKRLVPHRGKGGTKYQRGACQAVKEEMLDKGDCLTKVRRFKNLLLTSYFRGRHSGGMMERAVHVVHLGCHVSCET